MYLKSNENLRILLNNERYLWHENLRELKLTSLLEPTEGLLPRKANSPGKPSDSCNSKIVGQGQSGPIATSPIAADTMDINESSNDDQAVSSKQTPTTDFCDFDNVDLEDFIKEADDLLMQSLKEMIPIEETIQNVTFSKIDKCLARMKTESNFGSISTSASTERLHESSEESKRNCDNVELRNLTGEQILQMTHDIAQILTPELEVRTDKHTNKRKKLKKKQEKKSKPSSHLYQNTIKIDLKTSRVINLRTVPVGPRTIPKCANLIHEVSKHVDQKKVTTSSRHLRIRCSICNDKFEHNDALLEHLHIKHMPPNGQKRRPIPTVK